VRHLLSLILPVIHDSGIIVDLKKYDLAHINSYDKDIAVHQPVGFKSLKEVPHFELFEFTLITPWCALKC
jgi:hypothetical protein